MITQRNRWASYELNDKQTEQATMIAQSFQLPLVVAKLLVQRGIESNESVNKFLYGDESELYDPYLLADMDKGVARIKQALEQKQKIRIYGDYDADGVSSTTVLYYTFSQLGANFDYYIPHRMTEGYGLNKAAIELAKQDGVQLIVTVDTGISAGEEIAYANELGVDVVVTDHHEPPQILPNAIAVINPKQEHCLYPFKGLAGVGVAFKLATALLGEVPLSLTPFVALGTVADIMPLHDENRILVKNGLLQIKTGHYEAFNAIAKVAGFDISAINASHIGFAIGPRINAAGRLEHAKQAVSLLIEQDATKALEKATKLDALNKERQLIVDEIIQEADTLWQTKRDQARQEGKREPGVILLHQYGWNVGVIGIVASKLLERYYKPVIIFGVDKETHMAKGSARSIEGFDLHYALTTCEHLLDHYGGHAAAAGMSTHINQLAALEEQLSELAYTIISEEQWIPKLQIDLVCQLQDVTLETIEQFDLLEPFGMGNPSPRILINDISVESVRAIGKESNHLKLLVTDTLNQLDIIGFGYGDYADKLDRFDQVEVVGQLSINEWNNTKRPQLQLQDIMTKKNMIKVFPTREHFGIIYQYIQKQKMIALDQVNDKLCSLSGLEPAEVNFILNVFEELKFINKSATSIIAVVSPKRAELSSSKLYRKVSQSFELSKV